MALLYRFTGVNDRSNTGVFTFIVTRSVTRDLHRDATTKEFAFGHHRWVVSFNRTDAKMLGVHLILRNASSGTRCYVDYAFSLLNREHFSKNETYYEKQCRFNADQPAQGPARWVLMTELHTRKFSDENGEFLLDLTLSNPLTVFEADVRVSHFPFTTSHHKGGPVESAYFLFGGFEWNIAVHPQGIPEEQETSKRPKVVLNRLTGFDHPVRVQYRIVLGDGDRTTDSGILDQVSDMTGQIKGFPLKCTLSDVLRRGVLRVYAEMMYAHALSDVVVPVGREPSATTPNCYDREKQAWCVEGDVEGECLKIKLFCTDLHHVPRNHLRYVSWNAYVIRSQSTTSSEELGDSNSISVLNAPHCNYYMQDGIDLGIVMETNIPVSVVDELSNSYLETNKSLSVQIEWLDSLLLFSATYHKYDDICRLQCHQMKREIAALQAENYSLERQLFSYQKSISIANSRCPASDENPGEDEVDEVDEGAFYDRRVLSSEEQGFAEQDYT